MRVRLACREDSRSLEGAEVRAVKVQKSLEALPKDERRT